ncbi:MAG TPA: choice-of-anchor D domain-containing protein, partial [Bacteroidia bacterium]|nr:choice-of-anchor D domain-containing protein [Bacteroidia bacterium]
MKRILHALTTLCILSISITEAIAQTKVSFIPEITLIGNNEEIPDGDTLPITKNNTHFGNVGLTTKVIKEFIIENDGPSPLIVSDISFSGENASEFRLSETPTFPINIESNQHYKIQVVFAPTFGGTRSAF